MTQSPYPFSVRPFREADRPSLVALWQQVFPEDPPWNDPAAMIATKQRVQPELLLVAIVEDTGEARVVGAVMTGFDGVRGWIHHLAVAPPWRRRGVATKLMRSAEQGLQRLGCPKVNLQVRATNPEAIAFYQRLGYGVEERVSLGRRLLGAEDG